MFPWKVTLFTFIHEKEICFQAAQFILLFLEWKLCNLTYESIKRVQKWLVRLIGWLYLSPHPRRRDIVLSMSVGRSVCLSVRPSICPSRTISNH